MDVKEAVQKARDYILPTKSIPQKMQHIALEEVVFDNQEQVWKVTIAFFGRGINGKLGPR